METFLQDQQTILFIGDSITDCGRREDELGSGYVRLFASLLTIHEPLKRVRIINRGIGGNTVDDLRSRWHEDVLTQRPNWLSIKIGINDINRNLTDPKFGFLSPKGFHDIYDQLLVLTREALPETRILLIAPFFLSLDTTPGSYRAKVLSHLTAYRAAVRDLSEKHGALFLDLHELFQKQLRHQHPDLYCEEPVHPNTTGALFIAEALYRRLSKAG